ncbi:MAG: hypothetical protein LCH44_10325 [Bacteroidetes bacterium]|nr:hypothetical protein [Bacteroidota bacterium]
MVYSCYTIDPDFDEVTFDDDCAIAGIASRYLDAIQYFGNNAVAVRWLSGHVSDLVALMDHVEDHVQETGIKSYHGAMLDLLDNNEGYVRQRFFELWNLVQNDPYALVRGCENQTPTVNLLDWQDLLTFTPELAIVNYLNSFSPPWKIQSINDAYGRFANIDEYRVKINQMPKKPNGQTYTDTELVEHIRLTWNDHVNDDAIYSPLDLLIDGPIWNSSNPVKARIEIEITGPDDGAVVCAQKETNFWVFSTIKGPDTGTHPVSGNRQFGIKTNAQGEKFFYTKGVDRADNWFNDYVYEFIFHFADKQWRSMQDGVEAFINNHQGSSTKLEPVRSTPNWGFVKNALKGQSPITCIPKH